MDTVPFRSRFHQLLSPQLLATLVCRSIKVASHLRDCRCHLVSDFAETDVLGGIVIQALRDRFNAGRDRRGDRRRHWNP